MSRNFGQLTFVAIILLGWGGYEFFIQAGAFKNPTTISITDLEKDTPFNRHLIITGGHALVSDAVVYYETRNGVKEPGSELTFLPIQGTAPGENANQAPSVLILLMEYQVNQINKGKTFDENAIGGLRMTHWELKDKAREVLVKKYGEAAVNKMLIVEYEKQPKGVGESLLKICGGIVLFGIALLCEKGKIFQK